jgi:N-succinyldiaminopimelate aminotransferase
MGLDTWKTLFALSDKYGFVIAADECYSEIYFDESDPPLGALQAARRLGRNDYKNLVSFGSLSKRSNVPGMRSGYVAGDAAILAKFLLYRTYHGCALSPVVSAASIAAWTDEVHVRANRQLYRDKFDAVVPVLAPVLGLNKPRGAFYLWAAVPGSDTDFTRDLYARTGVTVLPGSFLAREAHGINPGTGRIRIALVAPLEQCLAAAHRIAEFAQATV